MLSAKTRIAARLLVVGLLAATTAGCFHPLYAEHTDGTPAVRDKLATVEVPPLAYANASPQARVGLVIRNELMFKMYGSGVGAPPLYRLMIRFNPSRTSLIVDPATALPTSENYGIDATYGLIEIATGKQILTGNTFSRVTYDIPGVYQPFSRARAYRDAENRAANEIAENINTRLAAFFYAGT